MRENLFKAICFLFFVLILIINNSYAKINPTFNTFHLDIFNRKITIKAENVNFKDILKELEKKTNIKIYILKDIVDKKVSIDIKNLPFYAIGNLLEKIDINDYVVLYDNKIDLYEIYISYPNKEIKKLIQNKSVIKKSNFLNGVNDKTVKGLEIETTIHDKNSYQIRHNKYINKSVILRPTYKI